MSGWLSFQKAVYTPTFNPFAYQSDSGIHPMTAPVRLDQLTRLRKNGADSTEQAASSPTATLTDDLGSRLADEITSGRLLPGTRLDEQSIADRFSTSRTPVREALRQLEAIGLVERRPYKGAVVATISLQMLAEMFTAMGEMEASCARLAALSATKEERAELRKLHVSMAVLVREDDMAGYARANIDFHEMIYDMAHNEIVADFTRSLRRRLTPFRRAQFRIEGRLKRSNTEHTRIIKAIEKGQADEAGQLMREHVERVRSAFLEFSGVAEFDGGVTFI